MASRISSAVSRRRPKCQSRRFSGSVCSASAALRRMARLPIGAAQDDQPVDRLEPPAAARPASPPASRAVPDGSGGRPDAEVVDRLDEADAEMVLPEPIGDDPGRQRMVGRRSASGRAASGGRATSAGSSGRSSATRMLGGRGPTGSPLFSQTPAARTWIGVRCARSFRVPGSSAAAAGSWSSSASISASGGPASSPSLAWPALAAC